MNTVVSTAIWRRSSSHAIDPYQKYSKYAVSFLFFFPQPQPERLKALKGCAFLKGGQNKWKTKRAGNAWTVICNWILWNKWFSTCLDKIPKANTMLWSFSHQTDLEEQEPCREEPFRKSRRQRHYFTCSGWRTQWRTVSSDFDCK